MKTYVMVPVPEELHTEVGRFLMEIDMRAAATAGVPDVEAQSVVDLLPDLSTECRTVLFALGEATVAEEPLSVGELARNLHWTAQETFGCVEELQEILWKAFGPKIALVRSGSTKGLTNAVDWDARQVVMWKDLAVAAVEAREQTTSEA